MVRDERSRLLIYAFIERQHKDQESNGRITRLLIYVMNLRLSILIIQIVDEYARSSVRMELDLAPGGVT